MRGRGTNRENGNERQLSYVTAGSGYASQNSDRLYFGLGEREGVERLTVRWPSGLVETFDDVAGRQLLRIVEGEGSEPTLLASSPSSADLGR